MRKLNILLLAFFVTTLLASCQAIGTIFSAGVWVGIIIVVIVIIVLFAVFRKRS